MKKLYVRCDDRMVFQISRKTLEALSCSTYDAYCFSLPDDEREYIDLSDWYSLRKAQEVNPT